MRCTEFDAHIDEMLSGILYPDANQHMRQCERCNSHYRARARVQSGLRKLATASLSGPSRATDRAVMEAYRRLQQRRVAHAHVLETVSISEPSNISVSSRKVEPAARLFVFPSRSLAPFWASRTLWSGAAAAALVFGVLGTAVHLWNGAPTVNAPVVATAPSIATGASHATSVANVAGDVVAKLASRPKQAAKSSATQPEVATVARPAVSAAVPVLAAKATSARRAVLYGESSGYDSTPETKLSGNVAPVIRLASTGAVTNQANVAQSASSTWPGYSNLMYCDPVVCSGPMQVVHIKVPVDQVKPNVGQSVGNTFVNADVVVGPDGVARAIRVAN